jgi:hypothetical protein
MSDSTLTVDQAVALLSDPPPPPEQAPAPAPEPVAQTAPEPEAAPVEEQPDELELALEDDGEAPEPLPVAGEPAPPHWSAEDQALWSQLTPEAQRVVARQEAQRQQQTDAARQQALAAQQQLIELARAVETRVPAIVSQYETRWRGWTPDAWANLAQDDPTQYTRLKAQHDAEYAQALQAQQTAQQMSALEQQAFLAQQSHLLAQVAPELADPEKGAERIRDVAGFLVQTGIPQDILPRISAVEWGLAHDAMLYRQLKQKAAARKPAPTAAAPPRAVAPTSRPAGPSAARAQQGLEAKLTKSGSIDDAVALLVARNRK